LCAPVRCVGAPCCQTGGLQAVDRRAQARLADIENIRQLALRDAVAPRQMGNDPPLRPRYADFAHKGIEGAPAQPRDIVNEESQTQVACGGIATRRQTRMSVLRRLSSLRPHMRMIRMHAYDMQAAIRLLQCGEGRTVFFSP